MSGACITVEEQVINLKKLSEKWKKRVHKYSNNKVIEFLEKENMKFLKTVNKVQRPFYGTWNLPNIKKSPSEKYPF